MTVATRSAKHLVTPEREETERMITQTLDLLAQLCAFRVQAQAWGELVVRFRFKNGQVEQSVIEEQTICKRSEELPASPSSGPNSRP